MMKLIRLAKIMGDLETIRTTLHLYFAIKTAVFHTASKYNLMDVPIIFLVNRRKLILSLWQGEMTPQQHGDHIDGYRDLTNAVLLWLSIDIDTDTDHCWPRLCVKQVWSPGHLVSLSVSLCQPTHWQWHHAIGHQLATISWLLQIMVFIFRLNWATR